METNKIIAALRKDCKSCGSNSICHSGALNVYCAVRDAAERLDELVGRCARYAEEIAVLRERQRWIAVTERLPETDDFVLVVASGKPRRNIELVNSIEIASFCGDDDSWILNEWPGWADPNISCWMPLPEAPGRGTGDD